MTLRVEQGKGRKDRYAMPSPVLLQRLRSWWRIAHAQGRMLPGGWLFPSMNPTDPLTARQFNRAVQAAAEAAGIDKRDRFDLCGPRHRGAAASASATALIASR